MWKTVIFLLITLIIIPIAGFYFDQEPLTEIQWQSLSTVFWIYIAAAGLCFIISSLSKNYSQVDKLWSIIPIIYVWVVCIQNNYESRLLLMAILATLWGIRLTYNFARRGGYSLKFWEGEEDYRWAILREKPEFQSPIRWMIFNLLFISYYQMGLILLFTLPIVRSIGGGPLSWIDYVFAGIFIFILILETIADQQQWNYQKEKYHSIHNQQELTGNYKKGFIDTGLWSLSRHPNYAAEQGVWIVFYCFSAIASGHILNWSIIGVVLLIILFKNSSDFSEEITANKYPEYKEYQKRVPRFIPFTKWNKS